MDNNSNGNIQNTEVQNNTINEQELINNQQQVVETINQKQIPVQQPVEITSQNTNQTTPVVEKKKKSSPTLLLCLLFLLIGAGASYYFFEVYSKPVVEQADPNTEELNTNGVLVNELINRIDYCGIDNELYKKSTTTVDTLDKNYINKLVAKEANGKSIERNISFTKDQFDNAINILFGQGVNLENKNIENCPNIIYDSANMRYYSDTNECISPCTDNGNVRHIVKAEKTSENIFITVAVANYDNIGKKVSNINDANSVVQGVDGTTFDISKDYEKVNNYKYTFNYDKENNNYIFKSIELVKNTK